MEVWLYYVDLNIFAQLFNRQDFIMIIVDVIVDGILYDSQPDEAPIQSYF